MACSRQADKPDCIQGSSTLNQWNSRDHQSNHPSTDQSSTQHRHHCTVAVHPTPSSLYCCHPPNTVITILLPSTQCTVSTQHCTVAIHPTLSSLYCSWEFCCCHSKALLLTCWRQGNVVDHWSQLVDYKWKEVLKPTKKQRKTTGVNLQLPSADKLQWQVTHKSTERTLIIHWYRQHGQGFVQNLLSVFFTSTHSRRLLSTQRSSCLPLCLSKVFSNAASETVPVLSSAAVKEGQIRMGQLGHQGPADHKYAWAN